MEIKKTSIKKYKFIFIFIVIIVVIGILIFPEKVFIASKKGLLLWFNTVFPSLFPFMIGAYLLIELGVVHFIGVLFEPIMRPIFNVPGIGAFAWIMGLISGYPVGAKITADLRSKKQITQVEAQRLISFSNNSGPLFILGSVSVGILSSPEIGCFLLLIHYLSSLSVGILFRFYKKEKSHQKPKYNHILKQAINTLIIKQKHQSKKIGLILKESIMNSMEMISQIGGFIILFSVISELLKLFHIMKVLTDIFYTVFSIIGLVFDNDLISGFIMGIIEITNGINIIGTTSAPLNQKIILINSIIAWGGLSIFMQTISMISYSDINIFIYGCSKFIQSIFAFIYTIIFYPYIDKIYLKTSNVFNLFTYSSSNNIFNNIWLYICSLFCIIFAIITITNTKKNVL
ncbi:sporulation integral membrane protein YlbJ [Defluviitalea phaphyphila]|uniref:sporulation integral membrane protein YlbJ n=1 Tax=Defluviitalea phaphyphila TaxID=1473580 RepID=UPI000730A6F1|nr:sporulation integral membrane protein YlbJ [Defluviitalea phaphyphila]